MELKEKLTETQEGKRLYQQEEMIQEITDLICELMERDNIEIKDLASRLRRSKGYVTRLLDGRVNISLRVLSDIFFFLGYELYFKGIKISG